MPDAYPNPNGWLVHQVVTNSGVAKQSKPTPNELFHHQKKISLLDLLYRRGTQNCPNNLEPVAPFAQVRVFAYATGQTRLRVKYLIDAEQNSQAARLLPTALCLKVRSVLPLKV